MIHKIKIQPTSDPVSLDEMRLHLGIMQFSDNSRDSIISGRIASALQWAEHYTRTAFMQQTLTGYDHTFPYDLQTGHAISLKSPLLSVVSVKYIDQNGLDTTLDPSLYLVDLVTSVIVPAWGKNWPVARDQLNSVRVEYSSGFATADQVPESIKDAIRFIVGQWEVFQNSMEGVMRPFTIPNAAKQLLDNYVDMREYF